MRVIDILNESQKREDYLIVVNKEKKYEIINKDGKTIGRKMGYENLEDALDSVLQLSSKAYEKGDFYKKKEMLNNEMIKWKDRNDVKEEKPKKKHGFYEQ